MNTLKVNLLNSNVRRVDKLGIYIATYNREKELKECLESFIPQIKPYSLPIYISDNSETDNTEKLVNTFCEKYPKIFYTKNKYLAHGRTFASNEKSVLSIGDTEFAWLFGDDDTIKPDAIDKIIRNLDKNNFLQLNFETYSIDMKNKLVERCVAKYSDEIYVNHPEDALLNSENSKYYATFISHIILRKSIIDNELKHMDLFENEMDFFQVAMYYRGISRASGRGVFIAEPLINRRDNPNATMFSHMIEVEYGSWYKAIRMLKGYYPDVILDKVRKRPLSNLITGLVKDKSLYGYKNLNVYFKYILQKMEIGKKEKAILVLTAIMPVSLIKALHNLYKCSGITQLRKQLAFNVHTNKTKV